MVTKQMCMAATEVNQILRYTDDVDVQKIPRDFRNFLKDIADDKYIPDINPERSLYDQKLLPETEELLGMIYYYYWSDEKEIENMTEDKKKEVQKVNHEIFQGHSEKEVFENAREKRKNELENSLTSIPKEPWYKRLLNWFKRK